MTRPTWDALLDAGLTARQAAEARGATYRAAMCAAYRRGRRWAGTRDVFGHGPLGRITRQALEPLWLNPDVPSRRIADALGVCPSGLRRHALGLGLPPRPSRPRIGKLPGPDFDAMWLAGVRPSDIRRVAGYAHDSRIHNRRVARGLPKRPRGARTITLAEWRQERAEAAMRAVMDADPAARRRVVARGSQMEEAG